MDASIRNLIPNVPVFSWAGVGIAVVKFLVMLAAVVGTVPTDCSELKSDPFAKPGCKYAVIRDEVLVRIRTTALTVVITALSGTPAKSAARNEK